MSLTIAHNIPAINGQRNLAASGSRLNQSIARLSSGYRVNTGADAPADLVISEQLRAQAVGVERAIRNTTEAVNLIGIAEGALNEMNSILKKMKALAIHSANNGVTSPEQVAADQAEMDSAIQTLERISATTSFAGQQLLNGAKELTYSVNTEVTGTQNNALLDTALSDYDMISHRAGFQNGFTFIGSDNADDSGVGTVNFNRQAAKAYLEVDTAGNTDSQVDADGKLTRGQSFILSGNQGARQFNFSEGAHLSEVVSAIHNVAESTGVDASLIFNSEQTIDDFGVGGGVVRGISDLLNAPGGKVNYSITGQLDETAAPPPALTVQVQTDAAGNMTIVDGGGTQIVAGNWDGASAVTLDAAAGDYEGLEIEVVTPVSADRNWYEWTSGDVTAAGNGTYTYSSLFDLTMSNIFAGGVNEQAAFMKSKGIYDWYIQYDNTSVPGTMNLTLVGLDGSAGETLLASGSFADDGASHIFTFTEQNGSGFSGIVAQGDASTFGAGTGQFGPSVSFGYDATPKTLAVLNYSDFVSRSSLAVDTSTAGGAGVVRAAGTLTVFGNDLEPRGSGAVLNGVDAVGYQSIENLSTAIQYGHNTDGQGRIWVKFTSNDSYELYKDASLSAESKVAVGVDGLPATELNGSGLEGIILSLKSEEDVSLTNLTGVYLSLGGLEAENGVEYTGNLKGTGEAESCNFDSALTAMSGVELGRNTDASGMIHTRTVTSGGAVQVFAYRDAAMREEDLVAKSTEYDLETLAGGATIILDEIRNDNRTAGTGLGMILSFANDSFAGVRDGVVTGAIRFENLAARVFATDYGFDSSLKVNQFGGALFTYYDRPDDATTSTLVEAGSTHDFRGQDATVIVDGRQTRTNGLELDLSTIDVMARLTFNAGRVGSTTLAQVGYGDGSIFTKAGALTLAGSDAQTDGKFEGLSGLLCNAGHVTRESSGQFAGGAQLHLGEGSGVQEQAVVSIQAMSTATLGSLKQEGYWDPAKAVWSERTFSIQDVMGGQLADLKSRPELAMDIIETAITDVSELRARLGAVQANMLQTNENNLRVSLENITKTESAIRDTDMATEMTEFTKNQILQNAGVNMLGQANQTAQSVMQLLN